MARKVFMLFKLYECMHDVIRTVSQFVVVNTVEFTVQYIERCFENPRSVPVGKRLDQTGAVYKEYCASY